MMQSADESVGRVLNTLGELGIAERTVLFFMSDNGGLSGVTSNAPLREGKGHVYEGGIRELYNLAEDVGERNNLAEKLPQKTAELRKLLVDWRKRVDGRPPRRNPNFPSTPVFDMIPMNTGAVAKWLRQRIANPPFAGSNPAGASCGISCLPPRRGRPINRFSGGKNMKKEEILAKLAATEITAEEASKLLDEAEQAKRASLYCKVSQKGAISIYGLQRMPVTLYVEQWERLLNFTDEIRQFAKQNDKDLTRKQR